MTTGTPDRPMLAPNYPVFTRAGRLFVSDSGTWQQDDGCIYVREPDGSTHVWSTAPHRFPNGLALDDVEGFLYVVESTGERVVRIRIEPDGSAGPMEPVVDLARRVPDGLAFDCEGGLLISCYRPDVIYRLSRDGALEVVGEDYCGTILAAPTNVCFGGASLDRLFIASLGRWHIAELRMPVAGRRVNYPELDPAGTSADSRGAA
jgi:gluconolactonase